MSADFSFRLIGMVVFRNFGGIPGKLVGSVLIPISRSFIH